MQIGFCLFLYTSSSMTDVGSAGNESPKKPVTRRRLSVSDAQRSSNLVLLTSNNIDDGGRWVQEELT
jgi:hypothetical protein